MDVFDQLQPKGTADVFDRVAGHDVFDQVQPDIGLSPYDQAYLKSGVVDPERVGEGDFTQQIFGQLPQDAANVSRALVTDAAGATALGPPQKTLFGNTRAAFNREPLPVDADIAELAKTNPNLAMAAHVAQDLIGMAPAMPALAAGGWPLMLVMGGQMLSEAPDQVEQLGEELGKLPADQDPDKIARLRSQLLQTTAFTALPLAHGIAHATGAHGYAAEARPQPLSAGEALRGEEPPPTPPAAPPTGPGTPPAPETPDVFDQVKPDAPAPDHLANNKVAQAISDMRKVADDLQAAMQGNQVKAPDVSTSAATSEEPKTDTKTNPAATPVAAEPNLTTNAERVGEDVPDLQPPEKSSDETQEELQAQLQRELADENEAPEAASDLRKPGESVQSESGAEPTVTPAPAEVKAEVQPPGKRVGRGVRARDIFDKETGLVGPDILEWISDTMPMMSKSKAKATWPKDKFRDLSALWDDAPKLQRPHHNVIYGDRGSTPDQVAEAAYREGKLSEPSVTALWEKIDKASQLRANAFKNERREEAALQEEIEQHKRWRAAKASGEIRVDAEELQPGDHMELAGEKIEVVDRDPQTGEVTLQDGSKFGRQRLPSGDSVYVQKLGEELENRLAEEPPKGEALYNQPAPRPPALHDQAGDPALWKLPDDELLGRIDEQPHTSEAERDQLDTLEREAKQRGLIDRTSLEQAEFDRSEREQKGQAEAAEEREEQRQQAGEISGRQQPGDDERRDANLEGERTGPDERAASATRPVQPAGAGPYPEIRSALESELADSGEEVHKLERAYAVQLEHPEVTRDSDGPRGRVAYELGKQIVFQDALDAVAEGGSRGEIQKRLQAIVDRHNEHDADFRRRNPEWKKELLARGNSLMEGRRLTGSADAITRLGEILAHKPELRQQDFFERMLTRAIAATKPGTAWTGEASLGLAKVPVWLGKEIAHNALKVVLEAWKAGKSVVHAIEAGVEWIRERGLPGFNEGQARDWLNQTAKESGIEEPTGAEAAPKSYAELQARGEEISRRLDEIARQRRGPQRVLPDELRSERYALSKELLELQRKLARDPNYVADLLRQMDATGQEMENARNAGNGLHVREAGERLRDLMDQFEQVPEDLRARTYNDLLARGEIMGSKLGELPEGRTLGSLTAWLAARKLDSPKVPWRDRLNVMRRLADEWSRDKDAATRVWARVAAGWQAFKEQYRRPPTDGDFRSLIKDWLYQKQWTGLETHRWVENIRAQVPQKLRRWALSVWLDADGSEAMLHSQRDLVPAKYRHIWDAALQLTPDEQALARRIKQDFNEKLEDALNLGLVEHGRENYGVPQIWAKAPESEGEFDPFARRGSARRPTAKLDPRDPFFALKRTNPTYFDGIMAGGVPKTLDVGDLVGVYNTDFHNALADRGLIKALREAKAPDGSPGVAIAGGAKVEPRAEGARTYFVDSTWRDQTAVTADGRPYRTIDHWALKGWKFASRDAEGNPILVHGDFLVHPDYYSFLKNELGQSWLRDPEAGGKYFNPILESAAFLKASKFASATFHLATIGEHALFHAISPLTRGVELAPERNPKLAGLMRHGMDLGFGAQREMFEDGLASHGGIWGHVPGLGEAMGRASDFLFKDYIPKIKTKAGMAILERNLKRYGRELSQEQIYELSARQANAAFGIQNWRLMGTNKTLLDMNRLLLTAPDFLLSRSKVVAQALKPYNAEQRYFLLAQAALVYTAARALNLVLDNDPHWEAENALSVVYHGRAYSARFLVNDIYHLAQDPASFASGRFGPLLRTGIETVTQRDMRTGARISVPFETDSRTWRAAQIMVKDLASWLVPVGAEGLLPGAAGKEETGPGQVALALGGVGSRRYTPETQVYRWASDFNRHSPDAATQLHQEQRDAEPQAEGQYRKLDVLLEAGKLDQARAEYQELLKEGHNEAGFQRHFMARPFTGQGRREQQFKEALSQAQREIYDRAIAERRQRLERFNAMRQELKIP